MAELSNFLSQDIIEDCRTSPWRLGEYVSYPCPNCQRNRLCECPNGKHRCEKCNWCPEDGEYVL